METLANGGSKSRYRDLSSSAWCQQHCTGLDGVSGNVLQEGGTIWDRSPEVWCISLLKACKIWQDKARPDPLKGWLRVGGGTGDPATLLSFSDCPCVSCRKKKVRMQISLLVPRSLATRCLPPKPFIILLLVILRWAALGCR